MAPLWGVKLHPDLDFNSVILEHHNGWFSLQNRIVNCPVTLLPTYVESYHINGKLGYLS